MKLWRLTACLVLLGGAGCENDFYASYIDEDAGVTSGSGGEGGEGGGTVCDGQCLAHGPLGWSEPALLWAGDMEQAPACPDGASAIGYEGYSGFGTALPCSPCACDPPPSVSCAMPETWTASSVACSGPGATTPFNAPAGWDGSCTAEDAIPAGALCNNSPCVRSLLIEPPVATAGACAPTPQVPPPAENAFSIFAKACVGNAYYPPCAASGELCVSAAPEGFATCIFHPGDVECPAPWNDKRIYYETFQDSRGCSACGCGPAEGASCIAAVQVFSDNACGAALDSTLVSSNIGSSCQDLLTGVALGSKTAEVVLTEAGACPPTGGEPIGDVEPNEPATFCCLE